MGVIIQTAHQLRVEPIGDAQSVQSASHLRKKVSGGGVQILGESGGIGARPPISFVLRIEDSQRVAFEPPLAVLRQLGSVPGKVGDECCAVDGAALGIAERVELEHDAPADPERLQNPAAQRDDLDVGLRLGDPDQLDADLVKLAEAPLLRSLIPEHRAAVEELEGHILHQSAREHSPHDPGRILRAQRHLLAAPVGERVHLLGDDVGGFADRAGEDFGELEDRRRNLGKAVELGQPARGFAHLPMAARRLGQEILRAADWLQTVHLRFLGPQAAAFKRTITRVPEPALGLCAGLRSRPPSFRPARRDDRRYRRLSAGGR